MENGSHVDPIDVLALGSSAAVTTTATAAAVVLADGLAKPFTGKTEAELNKYIDSTWNNFVFPPSYDEEIHWDVYLLYKSLFDHYSMFFVTPGYIEGFCIHLQVKDKKTEFRLDVVNLRSLPHKCPDLNALSLGTTEAFTAKRIIAKAHDRLVKMGCYHAIFNNCQDYCTEVASDIQVSNIFTLWSKELSEILQGIASITTTGAVAVGTVVESVKCMQRIGPQTGSSLTNPIKDLFDYYLATTKKNV